MPALPSRSPPWAPHPWSVSFHALLARLRPLHNTPRPPSHVRSCPLSLWERVFRATTPGLCIGFRWLSLAPFLLSWALRRPASPPAPSLPVVGRSRPRSRAVIPSARVAPHPLAARCSPAPWPCAPSPQNRVNPAKNPAKTLPRQPVPLRGTGWRGRVPPLIPHPRPVGEPVSAFVPEQPCHTARGGKSPCSTTARRHPSPPARQGQVPAPIMAAPSRHGAVT